MATSRLLLVVTRWRSGGLRLLQRPAPQTKAPRPPPRTAAADRYGRDSDVVINEGIAYAESLKLSGNGKESIAIRPRELPPVNGRRECTRATGNATTLSMAALGIKPVFLTDRAENQRAITTHNLHLQGLLQLGEAIVPVGWTPDLNCLFKTSEQKKLVIAGYAIVGNIGDQWSNILGGPEGCRIFKYPNPMYYVA
uniref:Uncharacterized protein n=1 Tax=Oryza sativa subsp. japonica TaxID=39947 RepID=Q60D98_ORYSJ|nr:hypothetical protein [Oryza sativa Japonica Group]